MLGQERLSSQDITSKRRTGDVITAIILIMIGLIAVIGGPYWYFTWRDTPHTLEEHAQYGMLILFLGLTIIPLIGALLLFMGGSLLSSNHLKTSQQFLVIILAVWTISLDSILVAVVPSLLILDLSPNWFVSDFNVDSLL